MTFDFTILDFLDLIVVLIHILVISVKYSICGNPKILNVNASMIYQFDNRNGMFDAITDQYLTDSLKQSRIIEVSFTVWTNHQDLNTNRFNYIVFPFILCISRKT